MSDLDTSTNLPPELRAVTVRWQSGCGVVIGPDKFITVKHLGGLVGQLAVIDGVAFETTKFYDSTNSDLRIVRYCGQLSNLVSIPSHNTFDLESRSRFIVLGRGTQRGDPVIAETNQIKGWRWGYQDGVLRWGSNKISRVRTGSGLELLEAEFNYGDSEYECHLSSGDSGGGWFYQDDCGQWKLCGLSFQADGEYNNSKAGSGFRASTFDNRGLFTGSSDYWVFITQQERDIPGKFRGINLSKYTNWISAILARDDEIPEVEEAVQPTGPWTKCLTVYPDVEQRQLMVSQFGNYFRLVGCKQRRITDIKWAPTTITLTYE